MPEVERWEPEVERWEPEVERWEPEVERWEPEVERWEPEVERWEPEVERWEDERPALWVKAAPGTYLGLWTAQAGGPGVGLFASRGGAHIHLAFLVPAGDLERIAARLEAAGIAPAGSYDFAPDKRSLYVDDPDGNVIELADWARSWEDLPIER